MAADDGQVTVLVADADGLGAAALEAVVGDVGMRSLGRADNAVEALRLAEFLHPDVVVLRHELPGTTGLEAAVDLRRYESPPEVVLIAADPQLDRAAGEAGVYAVVPWGDAAGLEEVLRKLRTRVETGERRSGVDRRSGDDRRHEQDWSKVFSERRSGDDRRKGPRREDD